MSILVLNTGSSSLKFGLFDSPTLVSTISGEVDWRGRGRPAEVSIRIEGEAEQRFPSESSDPGSAASLAIEQVVESSGSEIAAIGHRVVHGGSRFRSSVLIDSEVEKEIDRLSELAPLHNPHALAAIRAARAARPDLPQVAVFDTSFFVDMPRSSVIYPVPHAWTEDWGIRRFGFHGISHDYCAGRAAEILGRDRASLRLVICHLGNGCSASAVRGGRAIETTMGFTPLAGLMMGTRSGSVDPGILLYLLKERKLGLDEMDEALNHASGLKGVSGISGDYREVEAAAGAGNDQARLALEIYAARVRSTIGSLSATLGGLDALIFAAGVGENSASLRETACEGLGFLGLNLDTIRNSSQPRDCDIATDDSPSRILVVHTREELMIAREVFKLFSAS
ncbi:acetate/propionate family kinase [Tundrisphaera lichenicola]|uniref:acetate/propionate family kinase n=1 Tax=Tundrisphaera lichenicola TaxID=2029860 RepID=UPI003EBE1673